MKIEQIRLKNFRSFRDVQMRDIPNFAVVVGPNGSGKSTLFSVFGFLREAMQSNVTAALATLGGSRGFDEVRSRGAKGAIEIEIKFRIRPKEPLVTYQVHIDSKPNSPQAIVRREVLSYRRGRRTGKPWHFIDFKDGKGEAITNELDNVTDERKLQRESQTLKSPDLLAIKSLAQFEKFPAAVALGNLIEKWHISDFHIQSARRVSQSGHAPHLSSGGENLPLVVDYFYKHHKDVFDKIIQQMSQRIPGLSSVQVKQTEDGRMLLKFQDKAFKEPFLAPHVSDGTIKMLAYLVLLYDPSPHPLLCVEEPENQLYLELMEELAEEFRAYAERGGQVLVSTHSPDFLNAVELDEVFYLEKNKGCTDIKRANRNEQIAAHMKEGALMGKLWREGWFKGEWKN